MGGAVTVRLFGREAFTEVLGPGRRAVIWVQGCPIACPGCLVPGSWSSKGGEVISVAELADWVLDTGCDHLTLSGGEPTEQAAALVQLIDRIRESRDIGVLSYTGRCFEDLIEDGSFAQHEFLSRVDMLIDGPFVREQFASLLWRGSSNQRILLLTDRYRVAMAELEDESVGIEVKIDEYGAFRIVGVPTELGLVESVRNHLAEDGFDYRVGVPGNDSR